MTRDEIMAMDEDALRLRVVMALGWIKLFDLEDGIVVGRSPDGDTKIIPDYSTDIRAAYELEDALPVEKHAQYAIYLYNIILRKGVWWDWSMIHASAADRCRAWLWTMEA